MGAFQAGALLARFEAGLRVDLLHGSSVRALNAVFLAVHPDLEQGRGWPGGGASPRWWGCSGPAGFRGFVA